MALDFESKKVYFHGLIEKDKKRVAKYEKILEQSETDESAQRRLNDAKRILRLHQSTYEYMRPNNQEDLEKRIKILKEFPLAVRKVIPDDIPIVFHGTNNIGTVLQIIKTGGLLTPEQKDENPTSQASQIDVTYKNDIRVSCEFAEPGIDSYMPYGAIFVFFPLDEEKNNVVRTKGTEVSGGVDGVKFIDEPDRLFSIITTPENKKKIEEWCLEYNWPTDKVTTHEEFLEKCQETYKAKIQTITPSNAAKAALQAGISTDKVNEANYVEQVEHNKENTKEGVRVDD